MDSTQKLEIKRDSLSHRELWLFIINGKPHSIGLVPIYKYQKQRTPILETTFNIKSPIWRITGLTSRQLVKLLLQFYNEQIEQGNYFPGRYGDWIKCSTFQMGPKGRRQKLLNVHFIANAAWPKPTLASDLGVFVKGSTSNYPKKNQKKIRSIIYFIGILRKNEPGKGQPALIGGIRNVDRVFDSAAYTALKEAEEESYLKITYNGDLKKLQEDYNVKELSVKVHGFGILKKKLEPIPAKIHYITTLPTPESERNSDGRKRVYETSAFAILIDLGDYSLEKKDLKEVFQAGDDAEELYIQDVSECFYNLNFDNAPNFGLTHHRPLFEEMVKKLKHIYKI